MLARPDVLGPLGHLYGYGAGQLVTLTLLLWGTMRALPEEEDESARILPAFVTYWLLAAAALAFHAGLWVDKVVVYLHAWVRLKGVVDRTGGRFANGVVFRNGKITEYRSFAERMQALDRAGIQDRS